MQFRFGSQEIVVNTPTQEDLIDKIQRKFDSHEGFSLATINLDHLVKLSSSEPFRDAYGVQDFIVADGNPIVWLSNMAGKPVELVPGSELINPLASLARDAGVTIALIGSTDETLNATAKELEKTFEGLKVVETISPTFGFDPSGAESDAILDRIKVSGARMCFIALGAPKQEIFAARGRDILKNVGFASIGAGLDFISGDQKRAPKWVRAIAMEWAWRMVSSPRRLGPRYAQCFAILPRQIANALGQRVSRN